MTSVPDIIDAARVLAQLTRFNDRSPSTSPEELAEAFARVGTVGDAGVYITTFSGRSEWEQHPNGDELVQVLDGATTLELLDAPGAAQPRVLALTRDQSVIVPRGVWHRFIAPSGVATMTVTPPPTRHSAARDPRTPSQQGRENAP